MKFPTTSILPAAAALALSASAQALVAVNPAPPSPLSSESVAVGLAQFTYSLGTASTGLAKNRLSSDASSEVNISLSHFAKGGISSKQSIAPLPAADPLWTVYGGLFALQDDLDAALPIDELSVLGGTVGIDYRVTPNLILGAAFSHSSGDISDNTGNEADIDSNAYTIYANHRIQNFIAGGDLSTSLLYSRQDIDVSNTGFDIETTEIDLNFGLTFTNGGLTHGPAVGLRYIDGEVSNGGVSADFDSLRSHIGYQVSTVLNAGSGKMVPVFKAAWEHEFEDEVLGVTIPDGFFNEDALLIGASLHYVPVGPWTATLDYESRFGDLSDSHYVGLSAKYTF